MVLLYLLRQRKLSSFMSSYQAFRIFLQFIANSNWEKRGISIADREKYPSLVSEREWGGDGREMGKEEREGGREVI